jgi:hypothetical protein
MKLTRFGVALTAAVLAASALSGCSKVTEIRDTASNMAEQVVASGTEKITEAVSGNLFTAEGIDAAYSAITEKVGADPMEVVEVNIVPGVLTLEAIDPNAPTELNQWSYTAGAVGPSRPVDYDDDIEALQQNLFTVNDVAAKAIVAAINGAVTASEIQGGQVQSLSIKRNMPFDSNVIMFINVQGERSSKQVRADVDGQITDVV